MGVAYAAVGWNRQKRVYDTLLAAGVLLYLALFVGAGLALHPASTIETLAIRALGTAALLLLHVVLCIGPLCRLDRRFLPLLYNRRHMGVTMCLLGLSHALFALIQFHAVGNVSPLLSLLTSNARLASASQFPFELLGLSALLILVLMAATSHDFWLHNLSAPTWKALHMSVYAAYVLLVLHVALGALQSERHPLLAGTLLAGALLVGLLHYLAARKERPLDRELLPVPGAAEVAVCRVHEIPEKRARIVSVAGDRVAVFRYDGCISAVSNACQHQNGPLGEGRILDGCITCPWHGYQYLPDSGASPPPFSERVPTFRVRIEGDLVLLDPRPLPPGTRVEPARFAGGT